MWSGPRNLSTALMRAFENRPDTAVIDEPFYGVYLHRSGAEHPLRAETLAYLPTDPAAVITTLRGPVPGGYEIFYQKHMTHHMLPEIDLGWMAECQNVFLIREPEAVLASYAARRDSVTLADIGFIRQAELFDWVTGQLGATPVVIDAHDIQTQPKAAICSLCTALSIPFHHAMLNWPPGPRATDGPWAPAWYQAVQRSTAFIPPRPTPRLDELAPDLRSIAVAARPAYERLARWKLVLP